MSIKDWIFALRLHQWTKNILVFVPLILSHRLENIEDSLTVFMAFFVFGLVASANYLINDMVDIDSDRKHLTKKNRPLASGKLSIRNAILAIIILLSCSIYFLLMLPLIFFSAIALYLIISILYSLFLKKVVILDVIVLAGLYTMRIIAGAFVIKNMPTFWLLAFSMFLFFSLALIKRYAELRIIKASSKEIENREPYEWKKICCRRYANFTNYGLGIWTIGCIGFCTIY